LVVFRQKRIIGIGDRVRYPGRQEQGKSMSPLRLLATALIVILGAIVVGGALYLGFVESTPPETAVEKVLPDDRFPR